MSKIRVSLTMNEWTAEKKKSQHSKTHNQRQQVDGLSIEPLQMVTKTTTTKTWWKLLKSQISSF